MVEDSEAAKRLMRLLIVGFRYAETVEDTIWLQHPRHDNGRVIFYPNGLVSSLRSGDDQFAQIWIDETPLFDRFIATIKPTRRRDRLYAWSEDIIVWGLLTIFVLVVWGAATIGVKAVRSLLG